MTKRKPIGQVVPGFRQGADGSRIRTGPAASPATSPTKDRDYSDGHLALLDHRSTIQQWGGWSQTVQMREKVTDRYRSAEAQALVEVGEPKPAADYSTAIIRALEQIEKQVLRSLEPLIDRATSAVQAAVDALPDDQPVDALDDALEAALTPLNDRLEQELGRALKSAVREARAALAARWQVDDGPLPSEAQLLELAQLDGDSIRSWLLRRSPSRWMQSIADFVKAGVERDRAARSAFAEGVSRRIRDAIEVITRTATVSVVNQDVAAVAVTDRYRVVVQIDERTCSLCRGWIGLTGTLAELPSIPADSHPRCRCTLTPL